MAKPKKNEAPAAIGHNIDGFHSEIREVHEEILALEKQRKQINEKLGELRSRLETKGLIRKGQAAALSYFKLSPEDRKAFDNTYVLYREAVGLPLKGAQLDFPMEAPQPQAGDADAQKDGE